MEGEMRPTVPRRCGIVAGLLMALHVALLTCSAFRHSPVIDEIGHFAAGISHWRLGRFDLYSVNPPLVRLVATAPVAAFGHDMDWSEYSDLPSGRAEFRIGATAIRAHRGAILQKFKYARLACIPFCLIGGFLCWIWARELYGDTAGIVALALWCLSPNILGHGSLLTPDTAAAALGVTACFSWKNWLQQPSTKGALIAGVLLGLAELTKFTWLILYGIWPVVWIALRWRSSGIEKPVALSCGRLR